MRTGVDFSSLCHKHMAWYPKPSKQQSVIIDWWSFKACEKKWCKSGSSGDAWWGFHGGREPCIGSYRITNIWGCWCCQLGGWDTVKGQKYKDACPGGLSSNIPSCCQTLLQLQNEKNGFTEKMDVILNHKPSYVLIIHRRPWDQKYLEFQTQRRHGVTLSESQSSTRKKAQPPWNPQVHFHSSANICRRSKRITQHRGFFPSPLLFLTFSWALPLLQVVTGHKVRPPKTCSQTEDY